ncbi:ParA family protein [Streptacidiphilus sp. N1-3]|uniref:ParA family protein n=1 Tax=Streptacidiphilus alkalitolerans TaxID=3342712 RepID=A0ABV6XCI7_9ACTN
MAAPYSPDDREKVVTKVPGELRQTLKVRCAQLSTDMQDAVTEGVQAWLANSTDLPVIDTSRGTPFATWLPSGLYGALKDQCTASGLAYNQGVAQSVQLWLDNNPVGRPRAESLTTTTRRFVVANQKGGVGKTTVAAGVAQALAERGDRVLLVDFDPQCHLTQQLGFPELPYKAVSLTHHMLGETSDDLHDLMVVVDEEAFGSRLQLLRGCTDAFLLDAKIATTRHLRVRESALERVLEPVESEFDYIVIDCPPSLGYAMDTALYYGRTRDGEEETHSGLIVPVQAEDSSANAWVLLQEQVESLKELGAVITYLGFVVNLYDARKGYVVTSSLEQWNEMVDPGVLVVVAEHKEQREAVRMKQCLLSYAPTSDQAKSMRDLVRSIA